MSDTDTKVYHPEIEFSGIKLPEHETEVFGLILKHMFDTFTQSIADAVKASASAKQTNMMLNAMSRRREVLTLMECFEGLSIVTELGDCEGIWVKINGRAISEEMLRMVRVGCENFSRSTNSDYHCKIARSLKCHITPK